MMRAIKVQEVLISLTNFILSLSTCPSSSEVKEIKKTGTLVFFLV
jgi:hypothetical protein